MAVIDKKIMQHFFLRVTVKRKINSETAILV